MNALTTYSRRPAMGTFFETFLAGDDLDHLHAVADAVLDEVNRLARLLSRFDPAAEIARINREAALRPVRVDADVWDILCRCEDYRRTMGGYFDVTAGRGGGDGEALLLDRERQTVRIVRPGAFIDLGGFAKGYALDRGAEILRRFGVTSGLLNGGTSSIRAVGRHPDGEKWPIDIRDPFGDESSPPVVRLRLADQGFSCSAVLSPGQAVSDVIAPQRGEPLTSQAGCVVVAPTAAEAEALSTACLAMGKERAREYLGSNARPGCFIGWIDAADLSPLSPGGRGAGVRGTQLDWLKEAP